MPAVIMEPGFLPRGLTARQQEQVYNNLDSAITAQLVPVMLASAEPSHLRAYSRSLWVQALCLELSTKGLPCDKLQVMNLLKVLASEADKAQSILHLFCDAIWAPRLNPNSWQQVETFFYDFLALPPIYKFDHKTKQRKRATDRDALERLRDNFPSCVPFVNAILAFREATKLAGVFKKGLEADGSLRCSVSPTGTKTRRLSSQTNPFQRGTNAQNINDRVRRVVTAPKGWVLAYIDLKTAESFAVAFESRSPTYIDACTSGDLHTAVARLTWPDLAWTGELKRDRLIADESYYRDKTRRDMCKILGHASNYFGQPAQVSRHAKVPKDLVENFQRGYFGAFPEIPEWHLSVIANIQQTGVIRNVFGLERMFWGRREDQATWREAIAHGPQGTVAEIINQGLMNVQSWLLTEHSWIYDKARREAANAKPESWSFIARKAGLLMQVHDAGLFCFPIEAAPELIAGAIQRMTIPVDYGKAGSMTIPAEATIGRNWGKFKDVKNPGGLRDWNPNEPILI